MRAAMRAVLASLLMVVMLIYAFSIVLHMLLKDAARVHEWFSSHMCLPTGGRGNIAPQRAHREFAPESAAEKVHVPWGTKCQREIERRGQFVRGEASSRAAAQHHRHTMSV